MIIDYSFVFDFVYSGKIEGIEGIHLYGYILKEIDIYIYIYMDIEGIHDGRRNHYTTEACRSLATE